MFTYTSKYSTFYDTIYFFLFTAISFHQNQFYTQIVDFFPVFIESIHFFIPQKGLIVESCASTFEENLDIKDFLSFSAFVEETALQKVLEVSNRLNSQCGDGQPTVDIVIGADTIVTIDGQMYGKPINAQHASDTLKK